MSRTVKPVDAPTPTADRSPATPASPSRSGASSRGWSGAVGLALGLLLVVSGIAGLAVVDVHASGEVALLPMVQLLLGTAVVVRFTIGRRA